MAITVMKQLSTESVATFLTCIMAMFYVANANAVEWDLWTKDIVIQSNASLGMEKTDFHWNIGVPVTGPDVLSELQYNNQSRVSLNLFSEMLVREGAFRGFLIESFYQRAIILSGDNQDSDYFESGGNSEFSRSVAEVKGDYNSSFSFGGGYRWVHGRSTVRARYITLVGGLKQVKGTLNVKNGVQVVPESEAGGFPGLDSTYTTDWDGQYLGIQFDQLKRKNMFTARFEYFDMEYEGVGNWNLRDDFAHPRSFVHEADATGYLFKLAYSIGLSSKSYLSFELESRQLKTKRGKDTTFLADDTVSETLIFREGVEKNNAFKFGYGRWF